MRSCIRLTNELGEALDELTIKEPEETEAMRLARQMKDALDHLGKHNICSLPGEISEQELCEIPFQDLDLEVLTPLLELPVRGSGRRELAADIARALFPDRGETAGMIRYEDARKLISRAVRYARAQAIVMRTKERAEKDWRSHIVQQGPWDPIKKPISLLGPPALPMPVDIANEASLRPFFDHIRANGTHKSDTLHARKPIKEPTYGTPALEFEKGVVYEDQRLDLCKMVVGPTHIGALMDSLRTNTFIKHFLLGNNLIGPSGAREIANFIREHPYRIDTWYLAGNAIHGPAFYELVEALVQSPAVTNIWLKRNPLGFEATDKDLEHARAIVLLITETENLRTLDLDQTQLGDAGVEIIFESLLKAAKPLKLTNLYLNGNGIGVKGVQAIANYLSSEQCSITSLYLSNNPLGDNGAGVLRDALRTNKTLERLALQSVGFSDEGVFEIVLGVMAGVRNLKVLDLGTSYATEDLGQAYNAIGNKSATCLSLLLASHNRLEYLDLGAVPMDTEHLTTLFQNAAGSTSLLCFNAISARTRKAKPRKTQPKEAPHRHEEVKKGLELLLAREKLREALLNNVHAKHGPEMTYEEWYASEKRWLLSDQQDVRKIDSVYRTRDMGEARRGLKKLDKWWTKKNYCVLKSAMSDNVTGTAGLAHSTPEKEGRFWVDLDEIVGA